MNLSGSNTVRSGKSFPIRAIAKNNFRVWLVIWLLSALFGSIFPSQAQRAFSVSLTRTNPAGMTIRWKAQSATPVGDLLVIPQYQVERSLDLKTWAPISGLLQGTLGQTMSFVDTNGSAGFYRVSSIIDDESAELDNSTLDNGQLMFGDFFGAHLFSASFIQANLTNADFSAADVRVADFEGANLAGANLFYVEAFSAIFDNATVTGVDAEYSDFGVFSMTNTDLTGSDFSSAVLTGAVLDFDVWKKVKLDTNTLIDPKPLLIWTIVNPGDPGANLTNTDLSLAILAGGNLNGANLSNADLSDSDLTGADARGANFSGATLDFVNFQNTLMDTNTVIDPEFRLVNFILTQGGAALDLQGTNLSNTLLINGNLNNANLVDTECSQTVFQGANLDGANLTGADLSFCEFFQATLTNAILGGADFTDADLTQANLRNAVTNGAIFTGATFNQTIMPDGSIRNF